MNKEVVVQLRDLSDTFVQIINLAIDNIYHNQVNKGIQLALEILNVISETPVVEQFVGEDMTVLTHTFILVTEAIEHCDYVLMADLLEYELLPLFLSWKAKCDAELNKELL